MACKIKKAEKYMHLLFWKKKIRWCIKKSFGTVPLPVTGTCASVKFYGWFHVTV